MTDITYIRIAGGLWLYLCVVVDLYSGIVVGWSMSRCQNRQLVLQAVLMALWQRESRKPVILHSDRGCQFTSDEYQRFLKGHNLTCSMSGVGSCADNAACEGFFGMLKRERVNRRRYQTHREARADIFDYIECFYNPRRRRKIEALKRKKSNLIHLVDGGTNPVDEISLRKAIAWSVYLESHARRVYSFAARGDLEAAKRLLARIRRKDLDNPFSLRDVYRRGWMGLNTKELASEAATILVDFDWLREARIEAGIRGGRPRKVYYVCPHLFNNNRQN